MPEASTMEKVTVQVKLNGKTYLREVEPRMLLVEFLREACDLTGTHVGCHTTYCGACTVLLNGLAVKSCTILTVQADGSEITTARIDFSQAVTNKCPVGPNRGYSRLQHLWFLERVVDICAHELDIAPDEMRLRNYIRPEEFPYTTPNGCVYDSGNYPRMLEVGKKLIGWDDWRRKQQDARKEGRLIGIGIGTTLDSGTNNFGQSQIINPYAPFSGNS